MPAYTQQLPPLLIPQMPPIPRHDLPPEASTFSPSLLLALLVASALYLFLSSSADRFDEILHEDKHSEALAVLTAIFTPTTSSWPSDILEVTRRASAFRPGGNSDSSISPTCSGSGFTKGEIRLGFSSVYEHILNGHLECNLQPAWTS